ncbi:redoxin domain-containing protein [Cupriavidus sp. SZY C1]|uniref:redoxin domain-containing protein n=1 Tax=Cupriavidus sp. SZY C1 TaxID=3055037 RepID=UPI0028BC5C6B|nr:redoxin domain-containing protein [Cupriavidus sp. SZY C1]MDT6963673.1 redoxin domain-containing protein [Cupriavidus sp. SZY C1]
MTDSLLQPAPAWAFQQWFNTDQPLSLEALRGKVVVLEAFQMLCPGCVSHGLPQALRVHQTFAASEVAVIGLHTVFEHHDAMTPTALAAFLHEYRIPFPVGVDQPDGHGGIPHTMRAYAMRGTPTLVLIDAAGNLRHQHFGSVADLTLGAQIAALVLEAREAASVAATAGPAQAAQGCASGACPVDTK